MMEKGGKETRGTQGHRKDLKKWNSSNTQIKLYAP
jgi:hypothetical protein